MNNSLRYTRRMGDPVIHISEEEAARDFASVLARVLAGAEVLIEKDARPVAVLRPAGSPPGRLLSESIALAEAHGSKATLEGSGALCDWPDRTCARDLSCADGTGAGSPRIVHP
jgi:antitoxin (DNA-binding transcriptional repressor) of toxin-antitoxin stability system